MKSVKTFFALALAAPCLALAAEKPVFILNEDNDHYFKKPAEMMTREALERYVDNFAQGHVTHFFMCPSGQRASFDSKTVEPIWLGIGETAETTTATAADGTHDRWALNAKRLFDAGIDPYEVWTRRCREKGVSPWFTIRMNDVHGMGFGEKVRAKFRTTVFHRSRRDLWRNPKATAGDNLWRDGQFDYARREVREYMLRHILEVANRWDMDGIELDWMRFGYCLAQGRERADAHFVTEFLQTVRWHLDEIGKLRGRRIKLGCRVPRDPWTARSVGLFVSDWLDDRSLDLLVPHSFLTTDFELPVGEWLELVLRHDPHVRVVPGVDQLAMEGGKRVNMTPELYRGCIDRFYSRGATGVYFFNLPYLEDVADVLYAEGIEPETIAAKAKRTVPDFRDFPFKDPPKDVPELMRTADGRPVADRETWERVRRGEIRDIFLREIYGRRPAERPARLSFSAAEPDRTMLDGRAVRKRVRVSYGDRCGDSSFVFTAFVPTSASRKPAPAFLLVCNRDPKQNLDPERNVRSGFWPVEQIVGRGYAAIAFFNGDVAKDACWDYANGVFGVFERPHERTPESWGVLSAWAWGASRVMDWIETEPTLDARHVAVVGHSRGGKASLLAGVSDERFAMACVNCSGCGGAKLNHMSLPLSEHYDQIWNSVGCWFCGNFEKYLCREHEAPFDTHWWMSLMAPRLLAVASASTDSWAGQEAEFEAARLASPAWRLYGKEGLVGDAFPGADRPLQAGAVSYHMRTGDHNLTPFDWDRYMDFADAHGWKGASAETPVAAARQDEVSKWDSRMAVEKAAVDTNGVKWVDGRSLPIEGRAFDDVEHYYDRLPSNVTANVNGGVRSMKHHTAGMQFRFVTDSKRLTFRWEPWSDRLTGDNMAQIGASGIDVYRQDKDGRWWFVRVGRITSAKGAELTMGWTPGTPCLVNLPLYNGVKSFRLGIDKTASVRPLAPRKSGVVKPVVFYGTSITHGASASRPGLSWVNQVGRDLDVPVVNLGFSGCGRMEYEMSEHLARIDASCYVLDCLWNMNCCRGAPTVQDEADVRAAGCGGTFSRENMLIYFKVRYEPFIRNLRKLRPDVPIVMAEQCDVFSKEPGGKDKFIRALYERLVAEGWKNLVYLPKTEMYNGDLEGTIDGCHPNDWGCHTMALAFGKAVREALGLAVR